MQQIATEAARDYAAIERLLPQFIERHASAASGLAARRLELRQQATGRRPVDHTDQRSVTTVPFAYELWFLHLGELDQLAGAVTLSLDELTPEEARGLAMFRRAREKFCEEHQRCAVCSAVRRRSDSWCSTCGHKDHA